VLQQANSKQARDMFVLAQSQHWLVLEAIAAREGSRAQSLMLEHSRVAQRNLRESLQAHSNLPGVGLIRN